MDRRIARTRQSLQQALLELARERPLDEITVTDIADRANVNRSSFYLHYRDKETLLADALESTLDHTGANILAHQPGAYDIPEDFLAYLGHIEKNAALYRRVLGSAGSAQVEARLRRRVEAIVVAAFSANPMNAFAGLPTDVAAAGVTGAALGVITAWLRHEPLAPVEVVAGWAWTLLAPAVDRSDH